VTPSDLTLFSVTPQKCTMLSRRKQGWCVNVTLSNLCAKTCQVMYLWTRSSQVQKQNHVSYSLQRPSANNFLLVFLNPMSTSACLTRRQAIPALHFPKIVYLQEYLHLQRVEVTQRNLTKAGLSKAEHSTWELNRRRCSYSFSASPANRWIHKKQWLVQSLNKQTPDFTWPSTAICKTRHKSTFQCNGIRQCASESAFWI
jgi:hypothetical protein